MIDFVDYEPKAIADEMIKSFEIETGETLYPGDERRIFLQQLLPVIIALKADINSTGNQNLLRYSQGSMLDELGEMFDVKRIASQYASCRVQYNLSQPLVFDVIIKTNSRVTTDGTLIFLTTDIAVIKAGETSVTVNAIAESAGARYNGLVAHQVANMIDVIPYVSSVYNINTSSGGSDIESDNDYRNRIRLSYQQYSTSGSQKSYEYWTKTVSNDITDVSVESPSAGVVKVYVLPKSDYNASDELLNEITQVLSSDKHRPLTDNVEVLSAQKVDYDITLTYYISSKDIADEQIIKQRAEQAVEKFKSQTSSKLGISINADLLRAFMLSGGVYKIDVTAPVYTEFTKNQVGICNNVNVTYGGLK